MSWRVLLLVMTNFFERGVSLKALEKPRSSRICITLSAIFDAATPTKRSMMDESTGAFETFGSSEYPGILLIFLPVLSCTQGNSCAYGSVFISYGDVKCVRECSGRELLSGCVGLVVIYDYKNFERICTFYLEIAQRFRNGVTRNYEVA